MWIGYLYYFLNDFYNAEKYSLLAIEKGNKDSLFFLANLYKKQGKEKEAKQYYLLAIEKRNTVMAMPYWKQRIIPTWVVECVSVFIHKEVKVWYLTTLKK